jgi:hypothetical protein
MVSQANASALVYLASDQVAQFVQVRSLVARRNKKALAPTRSVVGPAHTAGTIFSRAKSIRRCTRPRQSSVFGYHQHARASFSASVCTTWCAQLDICPASLLCFFAGQHQHYVRSTQASWPIHSGRVNYDIVFGLLPCVQRIVNKSARTYYNKPFFAIKKVGSDRHLVAVVNLLITSDLL